MRPPVDHIEAPAFPARLPWINVAPLRMDQQRGRPVLVEFWDFCRPHSMRTLPYVQGWHERYESVGLRVIGIHSSGFAPSADPEAVKAAVARLAVVHPVVVDIELQIWEEYGNLGWPARYLFNQEGRLFDFHYGEGGYDETEAAIQELLGVERPPLRPLRPEDVPGARLVPQTEDVEGLWSGPYEAGGVWAVLEGAGTATANGREIPVSHAGAYELIAHQVSTAGVLDLALSVDVTCHAVCFTPGLADPDREG
ncbi:MAG TPA: DipZ protein [Solirubrobacteraceae bacterium]|jgi:thiol-disulfide isomerase/thioredoxin